MSSLNLSSEFSDVLNDSWLQGLVTVGTIQVEVRVGVSRSSTREMVVIHNSSNNTVYYGPSGVTTITGFPLYKNQWVEIMIGNNQALYLIAATTGNNVIVAEVG